MEPALVAYLRGRFGAPEAARIACRWRQVFGVDAQAVDLPRMPRHHEEYDDLLALLLEHAADAHESTAAVARWIAFSCIGENHLWEDLGLPDRPELTRLMGDCFPRLRGRNGANMRWKKFFYRQLCDRAQVQACRAPRCDACTEYRLCFGPEQPRSARTGGIVNTAGAGAST